MNTITGIQSAMLFLLAALVAARRHRRRRENPLLELIGALARAPETRPNARTFEFATSRDDTPGAPYRRLLRREQGARRARAKCAKLGSPEFEALLKELGADELVRVLLRQRK